MKKFLLASFCTLVFSLIASSQSMFDKVNDFDGDGKADYAVTRNENGLKVWHIWRSTAGYLVMQWGVAEDFVNAGDYDGDGKTDIAVTRQTAFIDNRLYYTTYYLGSGNGSVGAVTVDANTIVGSIGLNNEDYDGDGKADVGLFQWHGAGFLVYRRSTTGLLNSVTMGWFQVKVGDLNGDNAADIANFNISTNELVVVQGGAQTVRFGLNGDRWLAADFDGDNKGDIALFRPSTGDWWWIRSTDGVVNALHWGVNGDVPVPADYDHDGKTDHAVYRAGSPQSVYWVLGSMSGFFGFGWGIQTDAPVTY